MPTNPASSAGLALKPEHYAEALAAPADGLWFEVHAENYMVAGGPRLAWLEAIGERHLLALHGVGLSLAADADPDREHLARLAELTRRFEPWLVSEHLAWSAWRNAYYPDLLPFPRTTQALARIATNIAQVQDALGRAIAVENPSHYLALEGHEWDEIDFLAELARRTGCGLLLDVNNVFVSARNLGASAQAYIDAFPGEFVDEIHLAGHSLDGALLIDSHDTPVAGEVWSLYERLIARIGPRATLIERDGSLPAFSVLAAEWARAQTVLRAPALRKAA